MSRKVKIVIKGKVDVHTYIAPPCLACLESTREENNANMKCNGTCIINICKECVKHLRDDKCPICRSENFTCEYLSSKEVRKMAILNKKDIHDIENDMSMDAIELMQAVENELYRMQYLFNGVMMRVRGGNFGGDR